MSWKRRQDAPKEGAQQVNMPSLVAKHTGKEVQGIRSYRAPQLS